MNLIGFLVLAGALTAATGKCLAQDGSDAPMATARADFLELCADCHGDDAMGDGELTKNLHTAPPDLTRIAQRAGGKFDDKAVYDWIIGLNMADTHGSRDMPIWGDWLMDEEMQGSTSMESARSAEKHVEERVMAIVGYLKSIQLPK